LCDGDDDDASLCGLLEKVQNVGPVGRHVAGPVALEHHALDGRVKKVCHGVAADRREETEENHVTVESRVYAELHGEKALVFDSILLLSFGILLLFHNFHCILDSLKMRPSSFILVSYVSLILW
jgi:hypothetical protein